MELDIPPQDKLYYVFVTGNKDPKKLFQVTQEFMLTSGLKGSTQSQDIIVALSKKLTDSAYFSEAKLYMQLSTSEQPQAFTLWDEAARIAYIFDDYKQCIDLNKKALNLKQTAGQSGIALVPNHCNMGLAYFELSEYNEAINSLQTALNLDSRCVFALLNLSLVYKKQGNLDKALGFL